VKELFENVERESTAVFYTIWSYAGGAGRVLIEAAAEYLTAHRPEVTEYVTLSPKTDMAERFHTRNGASKWRENTDTVNYRYR
jgi:hypothetical protein